MDVFNYGPAFFAINEYRFDSYRQCNNSDEMFQVQERVLKELENEKIEIKNQEIDYGPPGSSEDEDSEEERKYYEEINREIIAKAE